jgi:hypothetical protein
VAGHSREATAGIDRISLIRDAANKVEEMILTEIDFAVPQPDAAGIIVGNWCLL